MIMLQKLTVAETYVGGGYSSSDLPFDGHNNAH